MSQVPRRYGTVAATRRLAEEKRYIFFPWQITSVRSQTGRKEASCGLSLRSSRRARAPMGEIASHCHIEKLRRKASGKILGASSEIGPNGEEPSMWRSGCLGMMRCCKPSRQLLENNRPLLAAVSVRRGKKIQPWNRHTPLGLARSFGCWVGSVG